MTRSEIVGANIAKYRNALGMNQIDFAQSIGRSQTMISLYESGQRLPSTKILAQIAKVLGVPFGNLFFSEEERNHGEGQYIDDTIPNDSYTAEERHLIQVYREALPDIRRAALQMLELNPAESKKASRA